MKTKTSYFQASSHAFYKHLSDHAVSRSWCKCHTFEPPSHTFFPRKYVLVHDESNIDKLQERERQWFLDCKVYVNYRFNWQNIHRLTGILGKTLNSFKLKKVIKLNLGIVWNFIFTYFFVWNVSLICKSLCCSFFDDV